MSGSVRKRSTMLDGSDCTSGVEVRSSRSVKSARKARGLKAVLSGLSFCLEDEDGSGFASRKPSADSVGCVLRRMASVPQVAFPAAPLDAQLMRTSTYVVRVLQLVMLAAVSRL